MQSNLSKNSEFHILTDLQICFLRYFSATPLAKIFYWSGGTALSEVYLQHRISHDIDLFTNKNISFNDLIPLIDNFLVYEPSVKKYTTSRVHDRKIFLIKNKAELKVEFTTYEYTSIKRRVTWKQLPIIVDTLDDIATNKIMSIMDRREPKDAVDIYYILQQKHYSLDQLLRWVQRKFGPTFDKRTLVTEMLGGVALLKQVQPLLLVSDAERSKEVQKIQEFYYALSHEYLRERFY